MTITKAIKTLQLMIDSAPKGTIPDVLTALNLGIQALNFVKDVRAMSMTSDYTHLPGETLE